MDNQPAIDAETISETPVEMSAAEQADPFVIEEIDVELTDDLVSMRC